MAKHVAVIGAGVGGLSAAIHLRLRGHRVTVIEQGPIGGKAAAVEIEGFRLDPGPSIIILPRIYRSVFEAAGRRMEDYLQFDRLETMSRVYFESAERVIDLPADRASCEALVSKVAPEDAAAFRRLMETLEKVAPHIDRSVFDHPYHRPWQLAEPHLMATALHFDVRKTYRDLVDGWFKSPLLRAFFYGFPSYGGQTFDSKAPGALLIPYYMLSEGVFYPRGGVAAIPAAFERLARELGVEFVTGRVAGFRRAGKQITAVTLADSEQVDADSFVSNVDRVTTRGWLGYPTDLKGSLSYYTLHWGIRRRLPGLEHHTLLIPRGFETGFDDLYRRRQFPERPIIYLNATSETDPATAPAGMTNLFAVVTSPSEEPTFDWTADAPIHRERVRQMLDEFGLGFRDDEIAFERVQNPTYFREAHGNHRGSLYGPDEAHRVFGLFPLRLTDEDHPNLFYCGGSVQPGAGLPMVTLSGRFVAKLI